MKNEEKISPKEYLIQIKCPQVSREFIEMWHKIRLNNISDERLELISKKIQNIMIKNFKYYFLI